ncbi:MAG TPA: hypothetical protein VFY40_22445 [Blastocatellia bacterium]|nr:hypothetical protein [Blastocatellia bacterium]
MGRVEQIFGFNRIPVAAAAIAESGDVETQGRNNVAFAPSFTELLENTPDISWILPV